MRLRLGRNKGAFSRAGNGGWIYLRLRCPPKPWRTRGKWLLHSEAPGTIGAKTVSGLCLCSIKQFRWSTFIKPSWPYAECCIGVVLSSCIRKIMLIPGICTIWLAKEMAKIPNSKQIHPNKIQVSGFVGSFESYVGPIKRTTHLL